MQLIVDVHNTDEANELYQWIEDLWVGGVSKWLAFMRWTDQHEKLPDGIGRLINIPSLTGEDFNE